jgi:hypothetical protein
MKLPKGFEIVETADTPERYMVLYQGYQWGKAPYDFSGCSEQTWSNKQEAEKAIMLR